MNFCCPSSKCHLYIFFLIQHISQNNRKEGEREGKRGEGETEKERSARGGGERKDRKGEKVRGRGRVEREEVMGEGGFLSPTYLVSSSL